MARPLLITTTIPYVNGDPHLGHAQEYVEADTLVRYRRLCGDDVQFLGGTDENSLKNVQAAEKAGRPVADFVAENAAEFLRFRETLNISFDDFIRTTEERHIRGAQKLWTLCHKDMYKKQYQGLYCVGCEAFYTEDELVDGTCPEHKTIPDVVEEENYFFRLSAYQKEIAHIIQNDQLRILPEHRKHEMLSFVERGLKDFSVSRSVARARGWGVPVPSDETQIMYVWFDALSNYINALDFAGDGNLYRRYWLQDGGERRVIHILGKGVARFHAVYWIGMLLSAGIPIPTEEFVHGYITVGGEKMSKSIGNVVNPHDLSARYGKDAIRYFFLGAIPAYGDGDFTFERFEEYYTAHLVNGIGNLNSRIMTMLEKYTDGSIPSVGGKVADTFDIANFWAEYDRDIDEYKFDSVVGRVNALVAACDAVISTEKPWERVKRGENISEFLYTLAETMRHIGVALLPIIPESAEKILAQFNMSMSSHAYNQMRKWGRMTAGSAVKKSDILFHRL